MFKVKTNTIVDPILLPFLNDACSLNKNKANVTKIFIIIHLVQ